jgi:hypothetical protein
VFRLAFLPPVPPDGNFAFASEQCRRLLSYWMRKRGSDVITRRTNIDPTEIPRLLPDIVMVQRIGEPPFRWKYTLVGTRVVDMAGVEPTGRHLDELDVGDYLAPLSAMYREICEHGALRVTHGTMGFIPGRDHVTWEALHVPLSDDGMSGNRVMAIMPGVPRGRLMI